jgi:hypothetical protein
MNELTVMYPKGIAMKRTGKKAAPEATQEPIHNLSNDPTILTIVSDMVRDEESRVRRVARGLSEPEVLRRAHPSLLLLDTPHRFI